MIGKIDPSQKDVTVVGGGISGLLAAYELSKRGYEVTLYEAAERAGGLIRTTDQPRGIVESAAHSFLATPPVRELCAELGVELLPLRDSSRARYVLRKGKLRKFPLGPGEAIRAAARAYFLLAPRGRPISEMTLEEWGQRFVGDAGTRHLIEPFVMGIYGARPSDLVVGAAFPALCVPRGQSLVSYFVVKRTIDRLTGRGKKRESGPMVAPRDGVGSLVAALEAALIARLGVRFHRGSRLDRLPQGTANIVLSVPADQAARLLADADPALSEALARIEYSPLVSVTVFVARSDLEFVPDGVGVLIPESEKRLALGVLFNSSAFEHRIHDGERWVSFTAMLGGTLHPEIVLSSWDDERIRSAVRSELVNLFGLKRGAVLETRIHRWPRAIPRYDGRLLAAWERARTGWCASPGHCLFGNYSGQVSLRGLIEAARSPGSGLAPL